MAFHGSLVERRLTVEEDSIAVDEMTVYDVAHTEVNHVCIGILEGERAFIVFDVDRFGTGVFGRTISDVHGESITIVGCDNLRFCKIHGDFEWNTELVYINVSIGGDNRACGEIYTFAHEIPAYTTGLCTHPGLQGLERASRALCGGIDAFDIVVDIGGNVVFEVSHVLLEIVARLTFIDLFTKFLVCADNIDEDVGEVIVHALIVVHHDGRSNCEGWNG
jgi:hypothetical protein